MANQFLVDIHQYIRGQIDQSREARQQAVLVKDERRVVFYDGKLDELMRLRDYLSEAFNLHTQQYD